MYPLHPFNLLSYFFGNAASAQSVLTRSATATDVLATSLSAKLSLGVALLLISTIVALAVGFLFRVGLKKPWQATLTIAGAAFLGAFGVAYTLITFLMTGVG